jgi:hypothetical protein
MLQSPLKTPVTHTREIEVVRVCERVGSDSERGREGAVSSSAPITAMFQPTLLYTAPSHTLQLFHMLHSQEPKSSWPKSTFTPYTPKPQTLILTPLTLHPSAAEHLHLLASILLLFLLLRFLLHLLFFRLQGFRFQVSVLGFWF